MKEMDEGDNRHAPSTETPFLRTRASVSYHPHFVRLHDNHTQD